MTLYFICLIVPLILSNALHMVVVKKNWLSAWTKPISTSLFGANKTWRGFVLLPIFNAFFQVILNFIVPSFTLLFALKIGAILGFTYMLFELPNSWLKRRLGIKAGEAATKHPLLFKVLDKCDSTFGVSLVLWFMFDLKLIQVGAFFLIAVATHVFFSYLLVAIKVKKRF